MEQKTREQLAKEAIEHLDGPEFDTPEQAELRKQGIPPIKIEERITIEDLLDDSDCE